MFVISIYFVARLDSFTPHITNHVEPGSEVGNIQCALYKPEVRNSDFRVRVSGPGVKRLKTGMCIDLKWGGFLISETRVRECQELRFVTM